MNLAVLMDIILKMSWNNYYIYMTYIIDILFCCQCVCVCLSNTHTHRQRGVGYLFNTQEESLSPSRPSDSVHHYL